MRRATPLTIGVLMVATAGAAGLSATAQGRANDQGTALRAGVVGAGAGPDRMQRAQWAGRGGSGRSERMRDLFDAVDADGDATVTRAEIEAYRAARIAEADISGDGALSLEEFDTLYRDFTRARMVDAFQRLDADGDAVISETEMTTRVDRLVERLDRNGDGDLTLQPRGAAQDAE